MIHWRKPAIYLMNAVMVRGGVTRKLLALRRFYRLPLEEQLGVQQRRLEALLRHAAGHVPYYRDLLREAGVVLEERIDLARFAGVPFLTKEILRTRFEDLKSDDLSRREWSRNSSGGSTGEPVTFIQDRDYAAWAAATATCQSEMLGVGIGEPFVKLWGSERDILEGSLGTGMRITNFVDNVTFLNAFRMDEASMARYARIVRERAPALIEAYAESAYELARYINRERIPMPPGGVLISSAGNLYAFMREEISRAFGRPVYDRYGSREVGAIAMETPEGKGMRVNLHSMVVEVLDGRMEPCPPGVEGEIVVTGLSNHAMPLVRFRIGDRGVPLQERSSPVRHVVDLQAVTGRTVDTFVTSAGALVNGEYFTHLMYFRPWVRKFQFLQTSPDRIEVRVVRIPGAVVPQAELDEIAGQMKAVMGPECQAEFLFTDEIPPGPSGKYRYTVSRVDRSALPRD